MTSATVTGKQLEILRALAGGATLTLAQDSKLPVIVTKDGQRGHYYRGTVEALVKLRMLEKVQGWTVSYHITGFGISTANRGQS